MFPKVTFHHFSESFLCNVVIHMYDIPLQLLDKLCCIQTNNLRKDQRFSSVVRFPEPLHIILCNNSQWSKAAAHVSFLTAVYRKMPISWSGAILLNLIRIA